MTKFKSKYFGEIDLETPTEFYESEIQFKDRTIEIVINTELLTLEEGEIKRIETFLDNIVTEEQELWEIVLEDFKEKGFTKQYIDILIKYLDKDDIDELISDANKKLNRKEKILSKLYVITINFYPIKEHNEFAVFDYTIDEELTNEMLVVILDKENSVRITVES